MHMAVAQGFPPDLGEVCKSFCGNLQINHPELFGHSYQNYLETPMLSIGQKWWMQRVYKCVGAHPMV